jgi:hypothetical protein
MARIRGRMAFKDIKLESGRRISEESIRRLCEVVTAEVKVEEFSGGSSKCLGSNEEDSGETKYLISETLNKGAREVDSRNERAVG